MKSKSERSIDSSFKEFKILMAFYYNNDQEKKTFKDQITKFIELFSDQLSIGYLKINGNLYHHSHGDGSGFGGTDYGSNNEKYYRCIKGTCNEVFVMNDKIFNFCIAPANFRGNLCEEHVVPWSFSKLGVLYDFQNDLGDINKLYDFVKIKCLRYTKKMLRPESYYDQKRARKLIEFNRQKFIEFKEKLSKDQQIPQEIIDIAEFDWMKNYESRRFNVSMGTDQYISWDRQISTDNDVKKICSKYVTVTRCMFLDMKKISHLHYYKFELEYLEKIAKLILEKFGKSLRLEIKKYFQTDSEITNDLLLEFFRRKLRYQEYINFPRNGPKTAEYYNYEEFISVNMIYNTDYYDFERKIFLDEI